MQRRQQQHADQIRFPYDQIDSFQIVGIRPNDQSHIRMDYARHFNTIFPIRRLYCFSRLSHLAEYVWLREFVT